MFLTSVDSIKIERQVIPGQATRHIVTCHNLYASAGTLRAALSDIIRRIEEHRNGSALNSPLIKEGTCQPKM